MIHFHSIRASPIAQLVNNLPCNAGDPSSISGSGRSPGEGMGYPLQYSGLENSILLYSPWGCKESDTEQLSLSLSFYKDIMVRACKHACVLGCLSSLLTLQRSHGLKPARLLCPWDFPGKNTGVGCRAPLQGIFPTQGSNPCLLHFPLWQVGSLPLSHLEASEIKITFSKSLYFFISSFLHWLNIS